MFDVRFVGGDLLVRELSNPERYGGLVATSARAAEALESCERQTPGILAAWAGKPVFVVGPRSDRAMRRLGLFPTGARSGHAAALGRYIQDRMPSASPPLLYLCGEHRRDDLAAALQGAGVPFIAREVYRTVPKGPLALAEYPVPDWVAFFSPRGVALVHQQWPAGWGSVRIAAIGPTTADAIHGVGWRVEAQASKPDPERLFQAVSRASAGPG